MARGVKVKLDSKGVGRFMRGPEVRRMVRASGDRIAAAAGPGFEADTWVSPEPGRSGQPRAVSGVRVATWRAAHRQARDNVLQRARGAGRM